MSTLTTAGLTRYDRQPQGVRKMPYKVFKRGNQWCVFTITEEGKPKGETHGCHATEAEAQAQLRALYVHASPESEKSMSDDSLLIMAGGAVKALGNGRIGGLVIPFGSPDALDFDGEFFTKSTDFGLDLPVNVNLYYHHGLDPAVGREPLGRATLKAGEDGIYFEADLSWQAEQRAKARKYRKLVYELAETGDLGASSGSAPHVVVKRPAGKGMEITAWPIAEISTTPEPANQATFGTIRPLKSLGEFVSLEDLAGAGGERPAPGLSLAERTEQVLDLATDVIAGYREISGKEIKRGRPQFSAARRERFRQLREIVEELWQETAPREEAEETAETEAPGMGAAVSVAPTAEDDPETRRLIAETFQLVAAQPDWFPVWTETGPGARDA